MPVDTSKSASERMQSREAFKILSLSRDASLNDINKAFKNKLADLERRYSEQPDRLVQEADVLYSAYRSAYLSKDGASEDLMLPLSYSGPDSMLNMFGINDVPHQSLKVQMQSQAQYKDGQLVKAESSKTESFINKDGKRETKSYENGKLVRHTIDGKNMLK